MAHAVDSIHQDFGKPYFVHPSIPRQITFMWCFELNCQIWIYFEGLLRLSMSSLLHDLNFAGWYTQFQGELNRTLG